jgi:hypothetical protein
MNTTRTGKIARLPRHIRNQLRSRLDHGERGQPLLEWLSQLPEVKGLTKSHPGGCPLTEQDLSEWKQGGYQQWIEDQQARDLIRELAEQADDLFACAEDLPVSDCLATLLATELARSAKSLLAETTTPGDRWQRLRELLHELARLRKEDHQALRVQMERERWDREQRRLDHEQHQATMRKLKAQATAPFWARLMRGPLADTFGGGQAGAKIADFILAVVHDLPIPDPMKPAEASQKQSDPPNTPHPGNAPNPLPAQPP